MADAVETGVDADGNAVPAKKKTRRGSRGGRNRKKPAAAAVGAAVVASENGADAPAERQREGHEAMVVVRTHPGWQQTREPERPLDVS